MAETEQQKENRMGEKRRGEAVESVVGLEGSEGFDLKDMGNHWMVRRSDQV